jgi:hypothetical protein
MSTTNRIVLLDSWGDELFSGESLLAEPPEPATCRLVETKVASGREKDDESTTDDEEPIPETLRSSVFRVQEPVSRPIVIEEYDHHADEHRAA